MNIQSEHREWLARVFPRQRPLTPATVMLEEAGELLQALSKMRQREQYGEDTRYMDTDWRAELVDAIGDCAVASCSLCNACGWDFGEFLALPSASVPMLDPLYVAVDLISTAAALVVDPQSYSLAMRYFELLRAAAECSELRLESCIEVTWSVVKERVRCR